MKGVVLGICPAARLVDLTHDVPPQAVRARRPAAAQRGRATSPTAPSTSPWSIPASARRARRSLVRHRRARCSSGPTTACSRPPPRRCSACAPCTSRARGALPPAGQPTRSTAATSSRRSPRISPRGTAPAGVRPAAAGAARRSTLPDAASRADAVHGEVVYVDRFGNLITNIDRRGARPPFATQSLSVRIAGMITSPLAARTRRSRPGAPLALIGSWDTLEVAVRDGNAAGRLRRRRRRRRDRDRRVTRCRNRSPCAPVPTPTRALPRLREAPSRRCGAASAASRSPRRCSSRRPSSPPRSPSALNSGRRLFTDPSSLLIGVPYAIAAHDDPALPRVRPLLPRPRARRRRDPAVLHPGAADLFFIGTLGAFIRMRSMPRDRQALFDVGAAGPWAGMLVAVPALVLGLALSEVQPAGPGAERWLYPRRVAALQGADVARARRHRRRRHDRAPPDRPGRLGRSAGDRAQPAAGRPARRRPRRLRRVRRALAPLDLARHADHAGRARSSAAPTTWLVWAVLLVVPRPAPSAHARQRHAARSGPSQVGAAATLVLFARDLHARAVYVLEPAADPARSRDAVPVMRRRRRRRRWSAPAMSDTRPSWDQYFMTITRQVAERSTCTARQGRRGDRARPQHPRHRLQRLAGRPAALPRRRLPGLPLADTRAASWEENCFRTIHAEINAIAQAAQERRRHSRRGDLHHPHAVHPLLQGAHQHRHHPHLLREASTSSIRSKSCASTRRRWRWWASPRRPRKDTA